MWLVWYVATIGSLSALCLLPTLAPMEVHEDVFHRFELMRHWYLVDHLAFESFVSPDGLHMNDWSYACLAKALGVAISEAALRTAIAGGAHVHSSAPTVGSHLSQ